LAKSGQQADIGNGAGNGEVVGHYALERNQPGPVAEGGQAVVDPAHRGRKILDRLKMAALDHAREIGLAGVWADAVTVHTFTQKANLTLGAKLCAVEPERAEARAALRPADCAAAAFSGASVPEVVARSSPSTQISTPAGSVTKNALAR